MFGGGTFVLLGTEGLPQVVGVEYPSLVDDLSRSVAGIDDTVRATFDTWYRALGWYWLVTGAMLFWITRNIEVETVWFRFINIGFMAVGVATTVTIAETGTNIHNRYGALIPEYGIPLLAIIWQYFVARGAVFFDRTQLAAKEGEQ